MVSRRNLHAYTSAKGAFHLQTDLSKMSYCATAHERQSAAPKPTMAVLTIADISAAREVCRGQKAIRGVGCVRSGTEKSGEVCCADANLANQSERRLHQAYDNGQQA